MRRIPSPDYPGVALADEHGRAGDRVQALRGADMVGVVVRQDRRSYRFHARAQRIDRRGQIAPVARIAGVDERELPVLLDEVEVKPPGPKPVDACGDLARGVRMVALATWFGGHRGPPRACSLRSCSTMNSASCRTQAISEDPRE